VLPEQEGYRFLVETRGAAGGPSRIWVHNPKLVKASAPFAAARCFAAN
jgi:4-carboxymuconolactone decarboxylase